MKKVLLGVAALVALLVVIAYLLPRTVTVERSITVSAPAAVIFANVDALPNWMAWSPWQGIDPVMDNEYSGPAFGFGATNRWSSENPDVGSGTQRIVESTPFRHIMTTLDFGEMGTATSTWDFDEQDDQAVVTWGFSSDMGINPLWRYMGLFMDSWVGGDFEMGLLQLKVLCETTHQTELRRQFIRNQYALDAAVRDLIPEQWSFQETEDRWSIAGIVEHLIKSEEAILDTIRTVVLMSPATIPLDSLDAVIMTAIRDRSTPVQTIPPLEPTGMYPSASKGLSAFHAARAKTLTYLADTDFNLRAYAAPHPIGMDLDAHQWFLFMVGHADRHLDQIANVMAHSESPK